MKATDRNYFVWDEKVTGFGVKVTPAGNKTYLLQNRTGERGKHGYMPDIRVSLIDR